MLGFSFGSIVTRALPAIAVAALLLGSLLIPGTKLNGISLVASCGSGYLPTSPRPTITKIDPNNGVVGGGTSVTITGTGFCANTIGVTFGATAASNWILDGDTQIRASSPPTTATGVVDITVTTQAGTSPINPATDHFTYIADVPGVFTPMSPLRAFDTRFSGGLLGAGETKTWRFGGVTVPANATAIVINTTVTNTTAWSFLTVYPAGTLLPTASNLNWSAGQTVANLVEVKLGANGYVNFTNSQGWTDVIADLEGYFAPTTGGSAGQFVSLVPSRITDTRRGSGQANAGRTLGPGQTIYVQVAGAGGVPANGAESVVINATVTNTTSYGFLTIYPFGQSRPDSSNLNWSNGGITRANRVSVPLGTGGMITVRNSIGNADVILDVNGYFTDSTLGGAVFVSLSPNRISDTRISHSHLSGGQTLVVPVAGLGGVPLTSSPTPPQAVIVNLTATNPTSWSFLTAYPDGTALPTASDSNFVGGQTVPNLVFVKVGPSGNIDITNAFGTVDVIVDVVGWFG
jgi:hypothetical protein